MFKPLLNKFYNFCDELTKFFGVVVISTVATLSKGDALLPEPEYVPLSVLPEQAQELLKACPHMDEVKAVELNSRFNYGAAIMTAPLEGAVDDMSVKRVADSLNEHVVSGNIGDIYVPIDSIGGDVDAIDDLVMAVDLVPEDTKVNTICTGLAASAASLFLVVGNHVYAQEQCQVLTHQARMSFSVGSKKDGKVGDYVYSTLFEHELMSAYQAISQINYYMRSIYQLKGSFNYVCGAYLVRTTNTILSSDDALRLGLVDTILVKPEADDPNQNWIQVVRENDPRVEAERDQSLHVAAPQLYPAPIKAL